MYTIHQILGTTLGLTVSGVKMQNALTEGAADSSKATTTRSVDDLLKLAKQKLDEASKYSDSIVVGHSVEDSFFSGKDSTVEGILKQVDKTNQGNKDKVMAFITDAKKSPEWTGAEKQKILTDMEARFVKAYAVLDAKKNADKTNVTDKTKDATASTATTVAEKKSNERKLKDIDYKIERETPNGDLKKDSMVALLADFDAMSGVEVSNRGFLRQALFGGGKQKEVVGEAQLYELLSRMDKTKLNQVYVNLTNDSTGLPWNPSVRNQTNDGTFTEPRSRYDFDIKSQAKIERFQRELADRTSMLADISETLLGKGARMGLVAVLEGRTSDLQTAISDPKKIEAFKKTIAESKVLDRDPNFLVKVVSFLIKIGIQVPLSLASSGMVGGYAEATDIIVTQGKDGKLDATRRGSLTVGEGNKSGTELSATVDLLGVRLDAKWNSPTARITGLTDAMIQSRDLKKDAVTLTTATDKVFETTDKDGKKKELSEQVQILSKSYLDRVTTIDNDKNLNPEQKKEIIANMTLTYLSRVESIKGTQLEGVFAAFNTAGWMVGLSGGRVDTAASFSGVRTGAARVEAEALARETADTELKAWLDKAGVTQKEGVYSLPDGKTITAESGKSIAWTITEEVHDDRVVVTAEPKLVSVQKGTAAVAGKTGDTFIVKRENHTLERIGNMPTDKEMADRLLTLRKSKGKAMEGISMAITANNYTEAKDLTTKLLEKSKNPIDKKLLTALNEPNQDLKLFFDLWLEKTSGGSQSRALADKIDSGKSQNIEDYYKKNKLNETFGTQYGLSSAEVDSIIASYGNLDKSKISTLGDSLKDGFHAIVAFAQINGQKASFRALDPVTNKEAQIIGGLREQTGAVGEKLKAKLAESLKPADLADYRKGLPAEFRGVDKVSDNDLKAFVIDGTLPKSMSDAEYVVTEKPKVSTYLSYSRDAECFNLGAVISSPVIKTPDTKGVPGTPDTTAAKNVVGTGSLVGTGSSHHLGFGLGVGQRWDRPDEVQKDSSTPGNDGGNNDVPGTTPPTPPPTPGGGGRK